MLKTYYVKNPLTKKENMREIVIKQNVFLNEAKIVSAFGIMQTDKQQVSNVLGKSLYLTEMESITKVVLEGNTC